MKKVSIISTSVVFSSILAFAPLAAFAQTATVGASVTAGTNASASLSSLIAKGDADIASRITALNDLSARIGEMKNVSAAEKTSLQGNIASEIQNLTSLKSTVDTATSVSSLRATLKSDINSTRIYILVLPQGRIAAAADRIATIVSLMQQLSTKLSARISSAQSAGVDVSAAQSAYTDMQTQIANANTSSQAALSETVSLTPDQGNTALQASNTAAVKDAAAKIRSAVADLKAARADIKIIVSAVKGTGSASATASTTAQ